VTLLDRLREAGDGWEHQERNFRGEFGHGSGVTAAVAAEHRAADDRERTRVNLNAAPGEVHDDADEENKILTDRLKAFNKRAPALATPTATSHRLADRLRAHATSGLVSGAIPPDARNVPSEHLADLLTRGREDVGLRTGQLEDTGLGELRNPVDLAAVTELKKWMRSRTPEPAAGRTEQTHAAALRAQTAIVHAVNNGEFDTGSHVTGTRRRALPTSFGDVANRSTSEHLVSHARVSGDGSPLLGPEDKPVVDEVNDWLAGGMSSLPPGAPPVERDLPADDFARAVRSGRITPAPGVYPKAKVATLPADLQALFAREALAALLTGRTI
jgi:hypothetical protein